MVPSVAAIAAVAIIGVGAMLDLNAAAIGVDQVAFKAADGVVLTGEGRRPSMRHAYEDYPRHLVDAIIMSEDHTFFENVGFSFLGKMRAAKLNFACFCRKSGGSGLTEQVIKVNWTGSWPDPIRKLVEPLLAVGLTVANPKKDILIAYLESAHFGGWREGVDSAASRCWGKTVSELTVNDSALLASGLPAPGDFKCGRGVSVKARKLLDRMRDQGKITPAQRARVKRSPLRRVRPASPSRDPIAWCSDWVKASAPDSGKGLRKGTAAELTCDTRLQAVVQGAVRRELAKLPSNTQAAVVVMRPDGAVAAMLGGKRPPVPGGGFNRATSARRRIHSLAKTAGLLTLLRAGWKLSDPVYDSLKPCEGYIRENPDGRYLGRLTLLDAYAWSRNPPWLSKLCPLRFKRWPLALDALGVPRPKEFHPRALLGQFEATLVEVSAATAAIVGGRGPVRAYSLKAARPRRSGRDLIEEAGDLCEAMRAVVSYGTGRAANVGPGTLGKTGSGDREALFVGAIGDLVIGVWVGPDRGGRVTTVGGGAPARIFRTIAADARTLGLVRPHPCGSPYRAVS